MYANMNNVIWDIHYYNWLSGYCFRSNEADERGDHRPTCIRIDAALVAWTFRSSLAEYGDSTDGSNIRSGWCSDR